MNEYGFFEPVPPDETANLKALERTVTAMRERDLKVRRAVGQFASAYDLGHK